MYNRSRNVRRYRSVDYVMPFLIIISLGVILILLFNLWKMLFSSDPTKAAYLHVVDGNVQMKTWGTEDFFDVTSDVVIMQGDAVRTSSDAKIIVEFFDGTIMRVDGDTDLSFEAIVDDSKNPIISLNLLDGNIWVNRVYKDTRLTDIDVDVESVTVKSEEAGIFEVESGETPTVRAFEVFDKDGLLVEIKNQEGNKVVATENVGVGQEIAFSGTVFNRYWQFQSPNVLAAVEDDFKLTPWYIWNVAEDKAPTQFEKYASDEGLGFKRVEPAEVNEGEEEEGTESADVADVADEEDEDSAENPLTKPTITSVAGGTQVDANGFYRISGSLATLTGTVSGADKVVVNGYTLQKFKPGDTSWTYYANADYGLMQEGENTYEVYALDATGKRSESLTVKVFYTPPAPAPSAPSEGGATETTTTNGGGSTAGSTDRTGGSTTEPVD